MGQTLAGIGNYDGVIYGGAYPRNAPENFTVQLPAPSILSALNAIEDI
jgi:hypothetical protein